MPNLLWKYAPICGTCLVCVDECVYVCVIWLWLYLFITHDITQLVALCDFMEVSFQASVSTSMWEGRRFAVTCQWVFKAESTINQVYGADEGDILYWPFTTSALSSRWLHHVGVLMFPDYYFFLYLLLLFYIFPLKWVEELPEQINVIYLVGKSASMLEP